MKKSIAATVLAALAVNVLPVQAQTFPQRTVTIVVPYSAGGPVDTFTRALGQQLAQRWEQPVVVLNKPGANEIIGADAVAKSAPDGYTLFAGTEAALTMSPSLYKKLPYNVPTDFAAISRMVALPLVFFVPKTLPVGTMKEFVAFARQSPKPLTYGSTGAGGIGHLPMVTFEKQEALQMVHVPYKGASSLIPDVITGQIDAALLGVSAIEQHVRSGALKALAISSDARSVALPNVPTFKESGIRDIQASFSIGLVAPKATPPSVINRISADVAAVIGSAEFRKKNIEPFSYVPLGSTPAEFEAFLRTDARLQRERIQAANVSLD